MSSTRHNQNGREDNASSVQHNQGSVFTIPPPRFYTNGREENSSSGSNGYENTFACSSPLGRFAVTTCNAAYSFIKEYALHVCARGKA